ncbi:DUF4349 domain-containing protein [Streptomyces liangshanensis]|uniref:DUF4349 domain-containing protein n=1 Tax=Streptomyces liangshanensis TaxID=2717324 RepID=UPI0036DB9C88
MRKMSALAAALLTVSLALAGCGAGGGDDVMSQSKSDEGGQAADRPGPGGEGAVAEGPATAAKDPGNAVPAVTHVIRTAQLAVEVKDAGKALATARSVVLGAGGLVEKESTERVEDDHVSTTVVLRVPQGAYDGVLRELAGTGKLLSRTASAKDVTDEVVDVESRVASQRVSVARVRELMDQATKLSDVVQLEGELSRRQADLESLLARQSSLKNRTTLATVTLDLTEVPVEKEDSSDDDPTFLDALGGGWDAFVSTLRWVAVAIGAVAPFAAALAVLYALWRPVRGRLRRPAPATVPAQATARPTPAAQPAPVPPTAQPAPTQEQAQDPAPAPAPAPATDGQEGPRERD